MTQLKELLKRSSNLWTSQVMAIGATTGNARPLQKRGSFFFGVAIMVWRSGQQV
jgi:hypothetical protein